MEDGLLSLKWNNHKTTFFDILRVLREKSTYTDATLAVEGKFYQVHKLVMSTCSEYFSEIFERTPCKSPVIVLKDVRSQDLEALLDYMYLGEVNVNQNDLALLLKTAECLRIKGLAVPDEDPSSKHRKAPDDRHRESPPPKRRRHTVPQPVPVSDDVNRAPSPANSKSSNTSSSNAPCNAATQPSQHTVALDHNQQDAASEPPPPMVKVEMEEAEDNDDSYMHDNNYDGSGGGGGGSEGEHRDFPDIEKAEHDIAGYGSNTYPAGPSVQGGELPWEEGDSSSFPPESFSGDVAGSQTQGGLSSVMRGQLMQILESVEQNPEEGSGLEVPPHALPHESDSENLEAYGIKLEDDPLAYCIVAPSTVPAYQPSQGTLSTGMAAGPPHVPHQQPPAPIRPQPSHHHHHPQQDPQQQPPLPQPQTPQQLAAMGQLLTPAISMTGAPIRFACPLCHKGFRSKGDLERHVRTHTGEKPYMCIFCPHRSATKGNLKAHVRHMHSEEKPFGSN